MNPFAKSPSSLRSLVLRPFSNRRGLFAFVACLMIGFAIVAWRAKARIETARSIARAQVRDRAALIELQLNHLSSTAKVLSLFGKQSQGELTNFQKVATELLMAHPGFAFVELQPGGVVNDIVPRAGHERTIGLNVFKDPVQSASANEAIKRHELTLAVPVSLDHGEPGVVARMPIFQKTADGRESLWGFVTVSMRLEALLSGAHVNDLWRDGYGFALFTPASPRHRSTVIASHGLSSLRGCVQQPVRALNLELALALGPRSGWVDEAKLVIEFLTVLLISASVMAFVNALANRHNTENVLAEAERRHAGEAAELDRAQKDCRALNERLATVMSELKETQLALAQAESNAEQVQSKLDASEQARDQAAQTYHAEQKEAHEALKRALETTAQLRAQLDSATQAEEQAAQMARQVQQQQATTSELKVRVGAAEQTAKESAAKVEQLERSNRELKSQLVAEVQAQARLPELEGLLKAAEDDLKRWKGQASKTVVATSNPSNETPPESDQATAQAGRPSETKVTSKAKAPKVRKASLDIQMHLFGAEASSAVSEQLTGQSGLGAPDRGGAKSSVISETLVAPSSGEPIISVEDKKTHESIEELTKPSSTKLQPKLQQEKPDTEGQAGLSTPAREQSRRLPPAPPVDPAQLRKACAQILPLLTDRDPGARDCLKDNRNTFRSAFTPEAFLEFEHLIKEEQFDAALEQLRKAARKLGISM